MRLEDIGPACRAQAEAAVKAAEGARLQSLARSWDSGHVPDPGAERELQRLCEHELTRRGIEFLHLSPRAREKIGLPDLTFPLPPTGQYCGVELKSATGRVSAEQQATLDRLERNGARVAVVRSLEEFRAFLDDNADAHASATEGSR